ncbi:MliC family protein [Dysgonomonas sp. OttesenSCG-928-D17]|nr:MliC family protein [Dysgonomonas sp. OttesenSCG-928-D17]
MKADYYNRQYKLKDEQSASGARYTGFNRRR